MENIDPARTILQINGINLAAKRIYRVAGSGSYDYETLVQKARKGMIRSYNLCPGTMIGQDFPVMLHKSEVWCSYDLAFDIGIPSPDKTFSIVPGILIDGVSYEMQRIEFAKGRVFYTEWAP